MDACRLLVVDLDGTLLRDDQTVDPRDRAALHQARRAGIRVVLASGRFPDGVRPLAIALGLDDPLVCADGAITTAAFGTATVLALPPPACRKLVSVAGAHDLHPMLVDESRVHAQPASAAQVGHLAGWAPRFQPVAEWDQLLAGTGAGALVCALAIGARAPVHAAAATLSRELARGIAVDCLQLGAEGPHTVRLRDVRADKVVAVTRLAAGWGIRPDEVAAVGDWYNDVGVLRWARHSFAMGGSPPAVQQAARHRLAAAAGKGGGVAEAIQRLLTQTSRWG